MVEPREALGLSLLSMCEVADKAGMPPDDVCWTLFHALCTRLAERDDSAKFASNLARNLVRMVARYVQAKKAPALSTVPIKRPN